MAAAAAAVFGRMLLAACFALAALPRCRAVPVPVAGRGRAAARSFAVAHDEFWRDGERVQVVSGELHYFRVPREYWRDRMVRMQALGFNTIQTYVAWNVHQPVPGGADFGGDRDVSGGRAWRLIVALCTCVICPHCAPHALTLPALRCPPRKVEAFVALANEMGFMVLLRPGPVCVCVYVCVCVCVCMHV